MINPYQDSGRIFTVKEVAEYFSVTPRTICQWIDLGNLPATKPGRGYRIPAESVIKLIQRRKRIVY